jgi:hypothetical protein
MKGARKYPNNIPIISPITAKINIFPIDFFAITAITTDIYDIKTSWLRGYELFKIETQELPIENMVFDRNEESVHKNLIF